MHSIQVHASISGRHVPNTLSVHAVNNRSCLSAAQINSRLCTSTNAISKIHKQAALLWDTIEIDTLTPWKIVSETAQSKRSWAACLWKRLRWLRGSRIRCTPSRDFWVLLDNESHFIHGHTPFVLFLIHQSNLKNMFRKGTKPWLDFVAFLSLTSI